jgi:hypothetical protein
MVSPIASGVPLGHVLTSTPVAIFNFSMLKCVPLPMPAERSWAARIGPAALAEVGSDLKPDSGEVIMTLGPPPNSARLVKSFSVS